MGYLFYLLLYIRILIDFQASILAKSYRYFSIDSPVSLGNSGTDSQPSPAGPIAPSVPSGRTCIGSAQPETLRDQPAPRPQPQRGPGPMGANTVLSSVHGRRCTGKPQLAHIAPIVPARCEGNTGIDTSRLLFAAASTPQSG